MPVELTDYDILEVESLGDYRLKLLFRNGHGGVIDFSRYFGCVVAYEGIRNLEVFRRYEVVSGILTWEDGATDIAPETLYHDATGEPYPAWLEP